MSNNQGITPEHLRNLGSNTSSTDEPNKDGWKCPFCELPSMNRHGLMKHLDTAHSTKPSPTEATGGLEQVVILLKKYSKNTGTKYIVTPSVQPLANQLRALIASEVSKAVVDARIDERQWFISRLIDIIKGFNTFEDVYQRAYDYLAELKKDIGNE